MGEKKFFLLLLLYYFLVRGAENKYGNESRDEKEIHTTKKHHIKKLKKENDLN